MEPASWMMRNYTRRNEMENTHNSGIRELSMAEAEQVVGGGAAGGIAMGLAGGWAGFVAGMAIGGPIGGFAGFALGGMITIGYSLATS